MLGVSPMHSNIEVQAGEPLNETDFLNGMNINITESDNENLLQSAIDDGNGFEGDIRLNTEQESLISRMKSEDQDSAEPLRAASNKSYHKWLTSGSSVNVPYIIHRSYSSNERAVIANAFSEFHSKTCIRY